MPEISTGEWIAFILMFLVGIVTFLYVAYSRIQLLLLAQPENRFDNLPKRALLAIKYGFGQYKMPDEVSAGLLHIAIFGGFMTVSLRTIMLFGQGLIGDYHWHLWVLGPEQPLGMLYAFVKDFISLFVIVACFGFMYRRMISKPVRMQNIVVWEPVVILFWISGLMLTDYFIEGALLHLTMTDGGLPVFPAPLTYIAAQLMSPETANGWLKANFWIHTAMILIFLNYLPFGKHFHVLTAIPNIFLGRLDPPGKIKSIDNLEELFEKMEEEEVVIGVAEPEHFTWKTLLDVYTCTQCGRCVPFCPAWSTDKPLSLRQVNYDIRHHLMDKSAYLLETNNKPDGEKKEWEGEPMTGGTLSTETIWACTMCRDCEERCPVLIEQVSKITEMRRYLNMIEGNIPDELAQMFRGLERNSNPWGLGYDQRAKWVDDNPDLGVQRFAEVENPEEIEYLFFVGCMGSFDDRSVRVTKALCKIMNEAGIKFAVLGEKEQCSGDTARRLGNEYLAQMQMQMNLTAMKMYGVKKIVTNCPHCFNTLKNEYADIIVTDEETEEKFQYSFDEVIHGQVLVKRLLDEGRIKIDSKALGEIAYHDSCFMGRYNDIYNEPRQLIEACGGKVVDPSLHHKRSFCCGAGGGRMWMEEEQPRVNDKRFKEIMETTGDPELIGVSCPFCMTMITDGSKNANRDEDVKIKDVLEIVADALVVKE